MQGNARDEADWNDRERQLDAILRDALASKAMHGPAAVDVLPVLETSAGLADLLTAYFEDEERFDRIIGPLLPRRAEAEEEAESTSESQAGGRGLSLLPVPPRDDPGKLRPAVGMRGEAPAAEFGPFVLLDVLGRGGMGVVYRALDRSSGEVVALKLIRAGEFASSRDVRRFQAEAEIIASLDHPNIVPIYRVDQWRGQLYYSMKLLSGGSLLRNRWQYREDPRRAATLVASVARAVAAMHLHGVLHRDLKPSNVLLDDEGTPYVCDFGLAKKIDGVQNLTATGRMIGTPEYMAPEQASGARVTTTATDIHGLGALLYALLTGRPPFVGRTLLEILERARDAEPPSPRSLNPMVDRDLQTLCLKCLEKRSASRYATAAEVADALEGWLRGEGVAARPVGPARRLWRWAKRRPTRAAIGAAALLMAALLTATTWWQAGREAEHLARQALEAALEATPEAAAVRLEALANQRGRLAPALQEIIANPALPESRKVRGRLLLLSDDPTHAGPIVEQMLAAEPAELDLIRGRLGANAAGLVDRLWAVARQPDGRPDVRLRAFCALATLDPAPGGDWRRLAPAAAALLSRRDPVAAAPWVKLLAPARSVLIEPLWLLFRADERGDGRTVATLALAKYQRDRPEAILQLLREARADQVPTLARVLGDDGLGLEELRQIVRAAAQPLHAGVADPNAPADVRRTVNAAVALLALDQVTPEVLDLYRPRANETLRTEMIHAPAEADLEPDPLIRRFATHPVPGVRAGLVLALGRYSPPTLDPMRLQSIVVVLQSLFRDDPDPGVHSAAQWTLRNWGHDDWLQRNAATADAGMSPDRGWARTKQGHTLALVHAPRPYVMGTSPDDPDRREPEMYFYKDDLDREQMTIMDQEINPRRVQIPHCFAIATHELTTSQLARFKPNRPLHDYDDQGEVGPNHPADHLKFSEVAQYCLWLDRQEGLPADQSCFEPTSRWARPSLPAMAADLLQRTGYRPATEAEWEYATRAGTTTPRFFGDSPTRLDSYAWTRSNSDSHPWPVGLLMPNGLGLCDVYGNQREWTLRLAADDPVGRTAQPVWRGSSYHARLMSCRSSVASMDTYSNSNYNGGVGLRLARTLPCRCKEQAGLGSASNRP